MNVDELAVALRNARPFSLRVILTDDVERKVAMPRGRMRYHAAAKIVSELPWQEVHCLDGKGSLAAVPIKRDLDREAGDLEPLTAVDPKASQMTQLAQGLATVITNAVTAAHKAATAATLEIVVKLKATAREELRDVMSAHKDLAQLAIDRALEYRDQARELEDQLEERREREREREELRAAQAAKSNGHSTREMAVEGLVKKLFDTSDEKKKTPVAGEGNGGKGEGEAS